MLRVHSYESMGNIRRAGTPARRFPARLQFPLLLYCANPDTIEAGEGTPTDPAEILRMAVDQKPFFGRRGGVTFSGGEPTFQAAELVPLVKALKEAGIHVCIDTNGGVWNPAVEELLGLVDLVLLDVKQADPARHRALTGRENTRRSAQPPGSKPTKKPFWLRYVLVPGYSDAEADIRTLGERLGGYASVERVELLPLPHPRCPQIRSDGAGIQTPRRAGKHPRTARPRRGPAAGVLPHGSSQLIGIPILRDKGYSDARQGRGFYAAATGAADKLHILVLFDYYVVTPAN